jgi:hypothetical protein
MFKGLGPFHIDVIAKFQQLDFVGDLVNRDGLWTLVQVSTLLFGF